MFDNPKKDLNWMNEQLLAQEQPEAQEEDWSEEEDWLDEELKEARVLMDNDYSRPARREVSLYDYDEEAEDSAEEDEDLAVYSDAPPVSKKVKKAKKEKGIGGLVFLACLETLGIIAVLLWWVLWLL